MYVYPVATLIQVWYQPILKFIPLVMHRRGPMLLLTISDQSRKMDMLKSKYILQKQEWRE